MRSEMKVLVVTAVAPFGIGLEQVVDPETNATPLRQDEGGQPRGTTMT
jgi:hypothetical protein